MPNTTSSPKNTCPKNYQIIGKPKQQPSWQYLWLFSHISNNCVHLSINRTSIIQSKAVVCMTSNLTSEYISQNVFVECTFYRIVLKGQQCIKFRVPTVWHDDCHEMALFCEYFCRESTIGTISNNGYPYHHSYELFPEELMLPFHLHCITHWKAQHLCSLKRICYF